MGHASKRSGPLLFFVPYYQAVSSENEAEGLMETIQAGRSNIVTTLAFMTALRNDLVDLWSLWFVVHDEFERRTPGASRKTLEDDVRCSVCVEKIENLKRNVLRYYVTREKLRQRLHLLRVRMWREKSETQSAEVDRVGRPKLSQAFRCFSES